MTCSYAKSFLYLIVASCLGLAAKGVYAQDTIRLVTYNLTNYGNTVTGCTNTNNGLSLKDAYFATIFNHVKPDVLAVNEMFRNDATAGRITTLLTNLGYATFARPPIINLASSSLVNTLYYRTDKLALKSHVGINAPTRTIDHFTLYYRASDLATNPDTAFINILVCHLKAGNTAADSTARRFMADAVVTYLSNIRAQGNYIITGDFNCYSANEPALTRLGARTSWPHVRFRDPLNLTGNWNSNSAIARHHTQSTVTGGNTCFSGGGLDDRFDMFFMNQYLLGDSGGVTLIPNSYVPVGNNGNSYNTAVNTASNTAAPRTILDALAGASDHLPITCQLRINRQRAGTTSLARGTQALPAQAFLGQGGTLIFRTSAADGSKVSVSLIAANGATIWQNGGLMQENRLELSLPPLATGVYHLQATGVSPNGDPLIIKPTKLAVW